MHFPDSGLRLGLGPMPSSSTTLFNMMSQYTILLIYTQCLTLILTQVELMMTIQRWEFNKWLYYYGDQLNGLTERAALSMRFNQKK